MIQCGRVYYFSMKGRAYNLVLFVQSDNYVIVLFDELVIGRSMGRPLYEQYSKQHRTSFSLITDNESWTCINDDMGV